MTTLTQPHAAHAALDWRVVHGPDIAHGPPAVERSQAEAALSACQM